MKIKKEIQKKVIYDYFNTNLKVIEIANKYNLCRQSIRHIILENNLKLKKRIPKNYSIKEIINDYINGTTNKEITQKYGLHRSTIQRILINNNIKLRPIKKTARKHQFIDENYFKNINNEEKAYVLGLLYADGYINKNGFGITLIENDKELLEKISNIIYGKIVLGYRDSKKIKNKYICKPQYRFEVVSLIMKNDLIKHGCMEKKTFKIRFPKLINDELYKHFIRGYFDGDGCLCIPTTRPENVTFTITSNINFCNELSKYVCNNVDVNMKSSIRYKDVGISRLTGRKQIKIFMNWLYENSSIYMKRKYEKFKSLK